MLEVKKIDVIADYNTYESIWKKLVFSMEYPSPFTSPEWIVAALKLNPGRSYVLVVVYNERVVALLPLLLKKNRLGIRFLTYCGDQYHPDPLGLCCHPQDRKKCIQAIYSYLREKNDWDVLLLKLFLHEESMEWKDMGAGIKKVTVAPFIPLPEQFDMYLAQFKSKRRNYLKRSNKKFDAAGGHYVSGDTRPSEQLKLLLKLFYLHEKRANEKGIRSTFRGQDIIDFHTKVLSKMDDVWLRALTVNDSIVAVLYGFLFGDRFFYYQIAHDPKCRLHGLGKALLFKVIRECCECGVEEFNFLQGGEEYKWMWTKNSRSLFNIEMYNRTFMATCVKVINLSRSIIKRWI